MTELITPDGRITEAGRIEAIRLITEERAGKFLRKWERQQGHRPKLPKEATKSGGMAARNNKGQPTVRQMIVDALASGDKTRKELAAFTGKSDSHVSAELSDLKRMGSVVRKTRKIDGFNTPVWSLP